VAGRGRGGGTSRVTDAVAAPAFGVGALSTAAPPPHLEKIAATSASVAAVGAREKNSWRLSTGPDPACTYWWLRAKRTWGRRARVAARGGVLSGRSKARSRSPSLSLSLSLSLEPSPLPISRPLARGLRPRCPPPTAHRRPERPTLRLSVQRRLSLSAPLSLSPAGAPFYCTATPCWTPLPHPSSAHLQLVERARQLHAAVKVADRRLGLLPRCIRHKRAATRLARDLVLQDDDVAHSTPLQTGRGDVREPGVVSLSSCRIGDPGDRRRGDRRPRWRGPYLVEQRLKIGLREELRHPAHEEAEEVVVLGVPSSGRRSLAEIGLQLLQLRLILGLEVHKSNFTAPLRAT
jgi:hypothetical protein